MSLLELAEYDFLDGNPFGMGSLGAKLTAAERKAQAAKAKADREAAAARRKADAAARRGQHQEAAKHRQDEHKAKVDAHKVEVQKRKEQADALKEARETAKQENDLSKMKAKIVQQTQKTSGSLKRKQAAEEKFRALQQRLNAAAVSKGQRGFGIFNDDLGGCCVPGLFGLGDCTAPLVDDGSGNCIDPGTGSSSGSTVPAGIQLPPFEPPAAPKGCEAGAHPNRKDCRTYTAVVAAFKQWYELLKTQLQYEAEIAALNAKIDALSAQLAAGGYGSQCTPGQIDPRTGQMCIVQSGGGGSGCPAGYSVDPASGQCTPITMDPTTGGYPNQFGIPGGGGGQFVPEQTLGPGGDASGGGDEMGLPSDFVPFGGGGAPGAAPALPYSQPEYAAPFAEQQASPPGGGVPFIPAGGDGQYAPPEMAVEIMPQEQSFRQSTAPEDVHQGEEPIVYGGDEEYAAVNDFQEEAEGMMGLTNLHGENEMINRYFGLSEGPANPPTDIYGRVITGLDKAKEIYEAIKGTNKPVAPPVQVREEFPWSQILIVGGLGLLGYAFYKKSQGRRR